jgi:hypothetical protein
MTAPIVPGSSGSRSRPKIDVRQLWSGGVATAIVAGLVALVGVLVCRWLFGVPILAPKRDGAYGDAHTTGFVLAAAGAALVATALAHLLLVSTPRPLVFFWWIVGLATVVVVLYPFSTAAPLAGKVATAAVDLVIGIVIGSLVSGIAERSTRVRQAGEDTLSYTRGSSSRSQAYDGRDPLLYVRTSRGPTREAESACAGTRGWHDAGRTLMRPGSSLSVSGSGAWPPWPGWRELAHGSHW